MKKLVKTLAVSVALALSITAQAQSPQDDLLKAINDVLGKPGARVGLIRTNQQVYYSGNRLEIDIDFPLGLQPLLENLAQLQLVVHSSPGNVVSAYPVQPNQRFLEGVIDTAVLPPGVYQLSLVLVQPNGNAANLNDWFGGYGALLSATRVKISENADVDSEDIDGDGFVEGDGDGDGYVDLLTGDHEVCSNEVLKGTYGYIVNGLTKQGNVLKDYVEVGFDIFDGKGNMVSFNANNLDRASYRSHATYDIDASCQGTVTYPNGGSFSMFVPVSGDDFYYLSVGDTPVESFGGRERRLTKMSDTGCSNSSLKGVYSYAGKGVKRAVMWIETGFEYFDGQGNVFNMYTNNITKQTEYAQGTYSVDTNCLGTTTYPDDTVGTAERYVMFVAPTGNEFSWMQIDGIQLYGFLAGTDIRSAHTLDGFAELTAFVADHAPQDPDMTDKMVCNMPAPADIPAGVEVKCGEGYQLVNNRCQLIATEQTPAGPLVGGPSALCPAGVMLKHP